MQKSLSVLLTVLICIGYVSGISAQQETLATGGNASGSGGSAAYSVGQVAYINAKSEDGSISLGVQQPYAVIMVGVDDPDIDLSVTVYPNPAQSAIHVRLDHSRPESSADGFSVELHNLLGKVLFHKKIDSDLTIIPLNELSDAVYFLRVTRKDIEVETFKIIKTE